MKASLKILSAFLSILLLICFFGCANNRSFTDEETSFLNAKTNEAVTTSSTNKEVTTSSNTPEQTMKKYEVKLTLDNYKNYLNVTEAQMRTYLPYALFSFSGCLSYAIYENVIITVEYSDSKTTQIKLNAGGIGEVPARGTLGAKIIEVSGTVTYWI